VGFSPLGLIVSIAVLAPNLLMIWFAPRQPYAAVRVPVFLTVLERAGQALCLVVPAITEPGATVWWWVIPAGIALLGYYALWVRYLVGGRAIELLYSPVLGIPVPMAILPVVVFLSAAGWLWNPWLLIAAVVLAAGHIPGSVITARAIGVFRRR
jgi:hypothetical protein